MLEGTARKVRSEDTWDEVRRAWEGGETAASVARRYNVGLANVWRRRASEGWRRREAADPAPEPVEGWDRYAQTRWDEHGIRLAEVRELAEDLARLMTGQEMDGAPLWQVPFLYHWRAEHMGPETAARDRARAAELGHPWAGELWNEDGSLKPLAQLDWHGDPAPRGVAPLGRPAGRGGGAVSVGPRLPLAGEDRSARLLRH